MNKVIKNSIKCLFSWILVISIIFVTVSCSDDIVYNDYVEQDTIVESSKNDSVKVNVDNKNESSNSKENNKNNKRSNKQSDNKNNNTEIEKDGTYTSKEEVAAYIYKYRKLPKNFITKNEAKKRGYNSSKGNLNKVAKGMSIGGDRFMNYEEVLPVKKGRKYYECDIDYVSGFRNAKRIVYADDGDEDIGFIFYTEDHYETFEKLY